METKDGVARIVCVCGEVFQLLNETGDDWDELLTAVSYCEHQPVCPAAAPSAGGQD